MTVYYNIPIIELNKQLHLFQFLYLSTYKGNAVMIWQRYTFIASQRSSVIIPIAVMSIV